MHLVDSHAHLYTDDFDEDIDLVINRAINHNINKIVLPNIDLTTIDKNIELGMKYPEVCYPCIGIHPCDIKNYAYDELKKLEDYINKYHFTAVGETGIDLYHDKTTLNEQIDGFRYQIELSMKYKLPLIMHTRDSFSETMDVLDKYANENLTGVFHCFSCTYEQGLEIIERGFYLGIAGNITYKSSQQREFLNKLPIDRILLETDAPYLAPVPHRGKRNESSYIKIIADFVSGLYGITPEELAAVTTDNCKKLFRI